MHERFRPNDHQYRRRSRGRVRRPRRRRGRTIHNLACVAIACLWAGCTAQKRYQVLSIFFDGVPDPNAPRQTGGSQGSTDASGAFKPLLASTHKPFVAEQCDACHTGGSGALMGFSKVSADVCLKCHQDTHHQYPMMHGPVAVTACLWCHNPHESNQPSLLKAPAPELCLQCHDLQSLSRDPPEHRATNSACLKCHVGHGGDQRYFLRQEMPRPIRSERAGNSATESNAGSAALPAIPQKANAVALADLPAAPAPSGRDVATIPATVPDVPVRNGPLQPTTAPADELGSGRDRPPEQVFLLQTGAPAAAEGPVVIGEAPKTERFGLGKINGALEFVYRRENDSVHPAEGRGTTFKEDRSEEILSLDTTAYYIHPNLLDLTLTGSFGLRQDQIENAGTDQSEDSVIYDYDLNGTLLRNGPAPFSLYSRRNTEVINRAFGPSLDATVTTTGGVLDWRAAKVPTRLEAYHMDQDLQALDDSESFSLSQNTFNWQSEAQPGPHQRLTWNYNFNQVDETSAVRDLGGSQTNSFNVHDAVATHTYDFGFKEHYNLTSSVNYFNQSGDFPLERLRWDERLRLRHTEAFETFYQYVFDYQSADSRNFRGVDQTQHSGLGGFTHRLYKSLVTSGNAGVRDLERSDGSGSFSTFGSINFDYHKQVPLGRLSSTLGFAYERQLNDAQSAILHVPNDVRTFNDPFPIVITGGNVDPRSIVVRNASGIIVYIEGLDYLVNVFRDRVEIVRVVGGRIVSGQTVLVSYDLLPQPSNTVTNNTFSTGLRYDIETGPLRGLGAYGRLVTLDQDIESDRPGFFFPNSYTDTVVGADYRFWEQRVTLGAEWQWHDSEIAPFDATRFYGRLVHRFRDKTNTTLALNGDYTILDYPDENNHVELLLLSSTFSRQLTRQLSGSVTLTYRDQHDEVFGPTQGVEGNAELRWRYRQTQVYVQARDSMLQTDPQDTSFESFVFGIRREF